MKQIMRKYLAILLTLMMLVTSFPAGSLAAVVSEASNAVNFGSLVKSVEPNTDVYVTFEFVADGAVVDTQIVNQTAGESVVAPATPEPGSGRRFDGWYIGDTELTFGTVSGYAESTNVTVTAKFTEVYYVYFLGTEAHCTSCRIHCNISSAYYCYTLTLFNRRF